MLSYILFVYLFSMFSQSDGFSSTSSILDINLLFESHFARKDSISIDQWNEKIPTKEEKMEMRQIINRIFHLSNYNNLRSDIINEYPNLKEYIDITIIKNKYCIIHEKLPGKKELFKRLWGYAIITERNQTNKKIHHSAAHFESDGEVCSEAAAIYEGTDSRSLIINGASRYSVKGSNPSPCQKSNQIADAAHNCQVMFHTMNLAIRDAAREEMLAENRDDGHFFIQWHGMAESSCLKSSAFISTGIGNSSIYRTDIPARRIMTSFNALAPSGEKATTPYEDPSCKLTAATNIFGRYVNGVEENQVCMKKAQAENIIGRFVHIEQKNGSRGDHQLWIDIINKSFP